MNIQELVGLNVLKNAVAIKAPAVTDRSFLLPDCKTGVELEFEGCVISEIDQNNMSLAGWVGKPDGSLREGGYEWIIKTPLANNLLRDAVYFAMDLARKRNYTVSVRTGLHTHVNVMDMTFEQYKTLLLVYAFIEPAIYAYASNDRDENVHCLPWWCTSDGLMSISDVYNSPEEYLRRSLENVDRYGGLNLAATRRFGSVEWRHMKATMEPAKIMEWIAINHRVKEAAMRLTGKRDLVADASTNPQWALEQVLQEELRFLWYNGIVADCAKIGVRSMLDIVNRGAPRFNASSDWDASQFTIDHSEPMAKFLKRPREKVFEQEYYAPVPPQVRPARAGDPRAQRAAPRVAEFNPFDVDGMLREARANVAAHRAQRDMEAMLANNAWHINPAVFQAAVGAPIQGAQADIIVVDDPHDEAEFNAAEFNDDLNNE